MALKVVIVANDPKMIAEGSAYLFNDSNGQVLGPDGSSMYFPGDWWEFPTCPSPGRIDEMKAAVKQALAKYPEFKIAVVCGNFGPGPAVEIVIQNDAPQGDPAYRHERFNAGALFHLRTVNGRDAIAKEVLGRLGYQG